MFYAAVEIRDQPHLATKPLAIGGLGMICGPAAHEPTTLACHSALLVAAFGAEHQHRPLPWQCRRHKGGSAQRYVSDTTSIPWGIVHATSIESQPKSVDADCSSQASDQK